MPPDQNQEQLWASMDELNFSQLPYISVVLFMATTIRLGTLLVQDNPEKVANYLNNFNRMVCSLCGGWPFLEPWGLVKISPIELGKLEEFPQWMSPIVIDQVIAGLEKTHPENTELF